MDKADVAVLHHRLDLEPAVERHHLEQRLGRSRGRLKRGERIAVGERRAQPCDIEPGGDKIALQMAQWCSGSSRRPWTNWG
jgi:hypothetical protein